MGKPQGQSVRANLLGIFTTFCDRPEFSLPKDMEVEVSKLLTSFADSEAGCASAIAKLRDKEKKNNEKSTEAAPSQLSQQKAPSVQTEDLMSLTEIFGDKVE